MFCLEMRNGYNLMKYVQKYMEIQHIREKNQILYKLECQYLV